MLATMGGSASGLTLLAATMVAPTLARNGDMAGAQG